MKCTAPVEHKLEVQQYLILGFGCQHDDLMEHALSIFRDLHFTVRRIASMGIKEGCEPVSHLGIYNFIFIFLRETSHLH